jgi:phosphoribosyl 1,2-cyclic phosphate phosphodiesterase
MKLVILGSGGGLPTPRSFCQCVLCKKARKCGEPYKRNSSSLFIEDDNVVIDCGEDIGDSLNRRNIKKVEHLFITHWHPDHTFGLRVILESNYDFIQRRAKKQINLYIPKNVFKSLKKNFSVIKYYINVQKTAVLHLLEDGDCVDFKNVKLTAVGYTYKKSNTYAYLIEQNNKRVLYAPCDTVSFKRYSEFENLDLLVNECGVFSDADYEISFDDLLVILKKITPKKIIFTHIEEIDLNNFGWSHLDKTKRKYPDVNFEFAYDGMEILI